MTPDVIVACVMLIVSLPPTLIILIHWWRSFWRRPATASHFQQEENEMIDSPSSTKTAQFPDHLHQANSTEHWTCGPDGGLHSRAAGLVGRITTQIKLSVILAHVQTGVMYMDGRAYLSMITGLDIFYWYRGIVD
ncbi:hypothetical protein B0H66DRAFT_537897 [Apodospora peruviana]|uniref:Uncharacterized protein n=1 Tax=Apodospora peruviana TaxID=516989 RepID=A0AAE0LYW8_9PEZI|nr:hypothetical protein B0H66DRAFT_537897 [Apodospora peruviana]